MIEREKLISAARSVLKYSYCKYSGIRVGAAISTNDGKIFTGCNIENTSFGLSICAERVALFKAISNGDVKFEALGITSSLKYSVFPCGACRQVLAEFAPDLTVFIDLDKKRYKLSKLIPFIFEIKSNYE